MCFVFLHWREQAAYHRKRWHVTITRYCIPASTESHLGLGNVSYKCLHRYFLSPPVPSSLTSFSQFHILWVSSVHIVCLLNWLSLQFLLLPRPHVHDAPFFKFSEYKMNLLTWHAILFPCTLAFLFKLVSGGSRMENAKHKYLKVNL